MSFLQQYGLDWVCYPGEPSSTHFQQRPQFSHLLFHLQDIQGGRIRQAALGWLSGGDKKSIDHPTDYQVPNNISMDTTNKPWLIISTNYLQNSCCDRADSGDHADRTGARRRPKQWAPPHPPRARAPQHWPTGRDRRRSVNVFLYFGAQDLMEICFVMYV